MTPGGLLDGRDLSDRIPLNMKSGSSGLLEVDHISWLDTLVKAERRGNLGCLGFIVVGLGFPMITRSVDYSFPVLLACFVLGLGYVIVRARIFRNLRYHAGFKYEIYPNKVVRFSDRNFQVIEYQELAALEQTAYGLVLVRKQRFRNGWRSDENPDLIVIPRNLKSYPDVERYILERRQPPFVGRA